MCYLFSFVADIKKWVINNLPSMLNECKLSYFFMVSLHCPVLHWSYFDLTLIACSGLQCLKLTLQLR